MGVERSGGKRAFYGGSEQAFPHNPLSTGTSVGCLFLPPSGGLDCPLLILISGIGDARQRSINHAYQSYWRITALQGWQETSEENSIGGNAENYPFS
ncbi:MAG: hypothetical protein WB643_06420 [Candidatus Bathyarchaeia archaeon]